MWIDVKDRLPEKNGEYIVMRRAIGKRPDYEDMCKFVRNKDDAQETYWTNVKNVVINSVTAWWEANNGRM